MEDTELSDTSKPNVPPHVLHFVHVVIVQRDLRSWRLLRRLEATDQDHNDVVVGARQRRDVKNHNDNPSLSRRCGVV